MTKKPSKPTGALARRPIAQAPLAQLPKEAGDRGTLGRPRKVDALFPTPPPALELPARYANVLGELKQRIEQTRLATVITANTAMVRLYWQIGGAKAVAPKAELKKKPPLRRKPRGKR